ncbi:hypothetical protein B0H12DRAFT_1138508 [Mycena haematopus]|nr:hypothetical protein B0H12DRAFT_1138508 [Mycena haematopus]
MPALQARASSNSSLNIGLILGLVVVALALIVLLVVLAISISKRRRTARNQSAPGSHERLTAKPGRVEKVYPGHHKTNSESMGPLLQDTSVNWVPQVRTQPYAQRLPSQGEPGHGYRGGRDEDQLGPRVESGRPIRPSPPPDLRLSISKAVPTPPSKRPNVEPDSPDSSDSGSMYSQRSASASVSVRMHTVNLASPPPPVPALPQHLRLRSEPQPKVRGDVADRAASASASTLSRMDDIDLSSPSSPIPSLNQYLRPRSELPPEEPPLVRGDTILVASLLKSRARHFQNAPERSGTRTSRIERADSIKEVPSPLAESPGVQDAWQRTRPLPSPTSTRTISVDDADVDANESFADTLEYYISQSIDSPRSPDDAMSVSSYETVKPRSTRPTPF